MCELYIQVFELVLVLSWLEPCILTNSATLDDYFLHDRQLLLFIIDAVHYITLDFLLLFTQGRRQLKMLFTIDKQIENC